MAKTKRYSRPIRNITKKRNVGKKHLGKKHTRKYLKKKGLDKKQKSSRRSKRGGNPEEELFLKFDKAAYDKKYSEAKALIEKMKEAGIINTPTQGGITPLTGAAINSLELVRFFLMLMQIQTSLLP